MAHRDLLRENAWVFDHQPGPEEIEPLLKQVPAWHGSDKLQEPVTMDQYMGYVVSISQRIGRGDNAKVVWRLYVTVSGKLAIMHDAHMNPDGTVVPIDEAATWECKNNLVIVSGTMSSPIYGTRFEAATGLMGDGAKGADLTNPVENAMTSWRGRAASALCGAGILPYTGIASAEEVRTANNREEMAEKFHTVIRADEPAKPTTKLTVTSQHVESIKKNFKLEDPELEEVVGKYVVSLGDSYDGSAIDWLLQQPVSVANSLMKFIRDTNGK
jgi:hypothetical protein